MPIMACEDSIPAFDAAVPLHLSSTLPPAQEGWRVEEMQLALLQILIKSCNHI
jgi:hypothetical protein